MSNEANTTWLSQEAHDRLQAELEELSTTGRRDIAASIEAAREEGDLKENAGYHAAKEEQGKMEARIRHLTELLRTATVGTPDDSDGTVQPGMLVTAQVRGEESTFLLGSREVAGDEELEIVSDRSPLGEALIGMAIGESGSYIGRNEREVEFTVIAAKRFEG